MNLPDRQQREDSIDLRSANLIRKKGSPMIVANLLGVSEAYLHKMRQKDLLPQNTDASVIEQISFCFNQMKNLIAGSSSPEMAEKALEVDTRLKLARTEGEYLNQKIKRKEFIELAELEELFTPVFEHIQDQLHSLARDYPEVKHKVSAMTKSWHKLGKDIEYYARKDEEIYVKNKMEEDIEGGEKLKELKELLGIYE